MQCTNCGSQIDSSSGVCLNCGKRYDIKNNSNVNNTKFHRIVILSMLGVIALLLVILALIIIFVDKKATSRTVMIYMSGSNLETDSGIATADLESIVPSEIDLTTTNVLVYAGGTKTWYNNYTSNSENNVLLLTNDGFKNIVLENKKNMGDSETFSNFLNYSYDNFKADKYDLIIYDHGLGALGSVHDDFSGDFLSLVDMKAGLKESRFNKDNKIETIAFRTCLNSTMEVASIFSDYAEYMIASEEVTLGDPYSNVLGFLNNVELSDSGVEYGNKFINQYKDYMSVLENKYGQKIDSTYALMDLSKVDKLKKDLEDFFGTIDVANNYNRISKIRANSHQYALESSNSSDYDTIDLYTLVDNLKSLSPKKGEKVLKTLNETVKTNWTTNKYSNGLSIYFPYYGRKSIVDMHFEVYKSLDLNEYYSFISKFNNYKSGSTNLSMNFNSNEVNIKDKKIEMKLDDDQVKNFAKANYIIYEKNKDGTYSLVVKSKAKLNKNVLSANLTNNIIKISNEKSETYIPIVEIESVDKNKEYLTYVVLGKRDDKGIYKVLNGNMHIKIKNNKVFTSEIIKDEKNGQGGDLLNIKDFKTLTFEHTKWNITDENGNYTGPKKTDSMTVWEYDIESGYKLSLSSLDTGDYYYVFQIYDVNNKAYYSKLQKVN